MGIQRHHIQFQELIVRIRADSVRPILLRARGRSKTSWANSTIQLDELLGVETRSAVVSLI